MRWISFNELDVATHWVDPTFFQAHHHSFGDFVHLSSLSLADTIWKGTHFSNHTIPFMETWSCKDTGSSLGSDYSMCKTQGDGKERWHLASPVAIYITSHGHTHTNSEISLVSQLMIKKSHVGAVTEDGT